MKFRKIDSIDVSTTTNYLYIHPSLSLSLYKERRREILIKEFLLFVPVFRSLCWLLN